jgi:hypothetical protein
VLSSLALKTQSVPGIEYRYAETGKIFRVARDEREVMFKRRCRNQAIRRRQVEPRSSRPDRNPAPAVGNPLGDRQQVGCEPCGQTILEPPFQLGTPLPRRHAFDAEANLSKRHHTREESVRISFVEPKFYIRVWKRLGEFG